jgi:hypothetical protein
VTPITDRRLRAVFALASAALLLAACESTPKISSQTAPRADMTRYHSYGYMPKLSTDEGAYTSITTQLMKDAVGRQLAARGLAVSDSPDLLVNFIRTGKDKVEGHTDPRIGVSYGHGGWGWGGWGVGVGLGSSDVRSVREETLTVDLVDRATNTLVWSGSAEYRPTDKDKSNPQARIDDSVARIFAKYPGAAPQAR